MSTMSLPTRIGQPPRGLIFFLALLTEAILLTMLAAWLRPMPPHRPVARQPMAVQLVPWPQHPPAQRVAPIPTPSSFPSKRPQPEPSTPREVPQRQTSSLPVKTKVPAVPRSSASSALAIIPSARTRHPLATSPDANSAPAPVPTPAAPTAQVGSAAEVRPRIPAYAHNPSPEYPDSARWAGEQGTVLLRVLVRSDGRVQDILVAASSGHGALDRAAEKAVRQWRFIPGARDGQTTAMWVAIPIRFRLQGAEK